MVPHNTFVLFFKKKPHQNHFENMFVLIRVKQTGNCMRATTKQTRCLNVSATKPHCADRQAKTGEGEQLLGTASVFI